MFVLLLTEIHVVEIVARKRKSKCKRFDRDWRRYSLRNPAIEAIKL